MRVSEGSVLKRRHIVPLEKMVSSIAIANGVQSRSGWREKWEEQATQLKRLFVRAHRGRGLSVTVYYNLTSAILVTHTPHIVSKSLFCRLCKY